MKLIKELEEQIAGLRSRAEELRGQIAAIGEQIAELRQEEEKEEETPAKDCKDKAPKEVKVEGVEAVAETYKNVTFIADRPV